MLSTHIMLSRVLKVNSYSKKSTSKQAAFEQEQGKQARVISESYQIERPFYLMSLATLGNYLFRRREHSMQGFHIVSIAGDLVVAALTI